MYHIFVEIKRMEVVRKRKKVPEVKTNTDPFLYKIDVVTIRLEA